MAIVCRCKVCNISIASGKSDLQKHAMTQKHVEKIKTIKENKNLTQLFQTNVQSQEKNNVKKAEIKLTAFYAANNIALRTIDQLEPILKEIFPDSKICQDMHLKRTKCTQILTNVLCKKETNSLVQHLQNNCFSILLDESTDIGDFKSLAVLVKYWDDTHIKTRLLELVQLDARNLDARHLYTTFQNLMEKHKIPIKNIIGKIFYILCNNNLVIGFN